MRDAPPPSSTSADLTSPPPSGSDADDLLHAFIARTNGCCPLCRYDLRGIATSRCPECGQELTLEIRLAEPRIGSWIALFGFVAMSFGWSATFGVLAATQASSSFWRELAGILLIITFLCSVPMLIATLWLRRRFLRLPQPARFGIVTITIVITLAVLAVFIAVFDG